MPPPMTTVWARVRPPKFRGEFEVSRIVPMRWFGHLASLRGSPNVSRERYRGLVRPRHLHPHRRVPPPPSRDVHAGRPAMGLARRSECRRGRGGHSALSERRAPVPAPRRWRGRAGAGAAGARSDAQRSAAVRGRIEVRRDDGTVEILPRATLCRCGGSANKPFCDNTHLRNGFRAPGEVFHIELSPVRHVYDRPIEKSEDPRGV